MFASFCNLVFKDFLKQHFSLMYCSDMFDVQSLFYMLPNGNSLIYINLFIVTWSWQALPCICHYQSCTKGWQKTKLLSLPRAKVNRENDVEEMLPYCKHCFKWLEQNSCMSEWSHHCITCSIPNSEVAMVVLCVLRVAHRTFYRLSVFCFVCFYIVCTYI